MLLQARVSVAAVCLLLCGMLPSEDALAPEAWQRLRDAMEMRHISELQPEDASATAAAIAEGRQAAAERLQQCKAQVNQEQLAVQQARALGTLRCANLGCTNLSAASKAQVHSKLCSGCRVVRFCSEACSQAAWRQHKVACKLLARQRQAQG
jgi:hypothetical protein